MDTVLYNTKVYFQGTLIDAGIAINDGKIVKIAKESNLPKASNKINLNGNITLPGLIDIHVHLRDQQMAYKETFKTGTAAAAAGGVTSVIDMPNNKPVTMDSSSLKKRMELAKNQVIVNVGFNTALPNTVNEIPKLIKMGAIGFKIYLSAMIGGINVDDDQALVNAFHLISKNNVPILIHAEDHELIRNKKNKFEASGRFNLSSYIQSHSPQAEAKSIQRIVSIIKNHRIPVHFCHLSSKKGLDVIQSAKKAGLPVTCEVTPHHLFLTAEHYDLFGNLALTDPPLRHRKDAINLWKALKQGSIDIIASDHAPHTLAEKNLKSVWHVPPGIPGLETTLPLLLNQINKGRLSFEELVKFTVCNPAALFHLSDRGFMNEGNWADLVVVDMNQKHEIDSSLFFSKAKYSPFDGMRLKGKPVKTFVCGNLVMDHGQIFTENYPGKFL